MGTRADFYVGKGIDAIWLGSIAWDGYPDGIDSGVLDAKTNEEFLIAVKEFLAGRDDSTKPEQGWPWAWNDSCTTDCSYAFVEDHVEVCEFGHRWYPATHPIPDEDVPFKECVFPNMKDKMNVAMDGRSGFMFVYRK